MKKVAFIIIFGAFLIFTKEMLSDEYVYPVGQIDDTLCIIHQTQPTFIKGAYNYIELLFWNMKTKEIRKGLLSYYTPAGLQVIPNKQAFSFIHDDFIRIKDLNKLPTCLKD